MSFLSQRSASYSERRDRDRVVLEVEDNKTMILNLCSYEIDTDGEGVGCVMKDENMQVYV